VKNVLSEYGLENLAVLDKRPRVLIAIHASHSQPEQMQAQRETWLRKLYGLADYKFFLGHPHCDDADVVSLEIPDGPIWLNQRNGPRTLVLNRKTEGLIKYAFENEYDYVFKCDDDTYVWPDRLLWSSFEKYDYSGFVERHYAREIGFYHWAQGGAGYWLSRKAMDIIAQHGLHLVAAEDFAVGQILARHGIHPHHDSRYIPGATPKDLANPSQNVLTLHKVTPSEMHLLHDRQREQR